MSGYGYSHDPHDQSRDDAARAAAPPQRPAVAFKPGDRVRVVQGQFAGRVGEVDYVTEYGSMLTLLDGKVKVSFDPQSLEPAPPPAAADGGLQSDAAAVLRKGIRDYLDGDYPHPRSYRPNRCPHGREYYEPCEECDTAHWVAVLEAGDAALATHLAENEALKAETARLEERNRDAQMLAFKWMERHDKVIGHLQRGGSLRDMPSFLYPSPVDVPAAESRATRAEAALASAAPEGWVVVPIHPTTEMKTKLAHAVGGNWDIGHYAYEQALSVAPKPPRRASSTLAAIKGEGAGNG
jgi:hypothetical protein